MDINNRIKSINDYADKLRPVPVKRKIALKLKEELKILDKYKNKYDSQLDKVKSLYEDLNR